VVVAMAAMEMAVVAAVMRANKKVVEVVVTTNAIIAIEIRRSTKTLLAISVTVFLLATPAITSIVVLMTARPIRTCTISSMTPNTTP
jgi:uncharacterized UPF0146 family protein